MRVTDVMSLAAVLALAVPAGAAPTLALAQASPPTAQGAEAQPSAPADEADTAPAAEPRIDAPFGHAWLGAADGDVTLVVFADYACPACREAQGAIDQLLALEPRLKVVYRLLDNDQGGRTAALTSLAVARDSANWPRFHRALDAAGEPKVQAIAAALAAGGISPNPLPDPQAEDPQTVELVDELSRNDNLITERHGSAIPAWVVGDGPAQKGFDLPRLQAAIAQARAGAQAGGTH